MELKDLIREIHQLEWQMRAYEDKYGLLSRDFYEALQTGELAEFDGEEGYHLDFLEWAGLYQIWLDRQRAYQELLRKQPFAEHIHRVTMVA
ncbi:MAG: hypothetical protein D6759_12585 [Chloroflexi bacterium]|nr:MAG: hypothetical protein D6759_12585 [Chloroflexota bacterium]